MCVIYLSQHQRVQGFTSIRKIHGIIDHKYLYFLRSYIDRVGQYGYTPYGAAARIHPNGVIHTLLVN